MQVLTLAHADSNEVPFDASHPHSLATPPPDSRDCTLQSAFQDFIRPSLQTSHCSSWESARGLGNQALVSQRSKRSSAEVELHTPRSSQPHSSFNRLSSMEPANHFRRSHDMLDQHAQQQSHDFLPRVSDDAWDAHLQRFSEFEAQSDLGRQSQETQREGYQRR